MQVFDRPEPGERAVLVDTDIHSDPDSMAELKALALSAGARPVAEMLGRRVSPDARFFIGSGKLRELAEVVGKCEADLVIFNNVLSPGQERNLERELNVRVVDRTGLILDIFAQRARTFEGKLQVELAQLKHLATRLVRRWTHLERQKGGIGLRGPGETQLETDKRLIGKRISHLEKCLEKVDRQRGRGRVSRRRSDLPVVSLVGYTNAGKSTLFNTLTGAGVFAADRLFATLDPTVRRVLLSSGLAVIVTDTVGLIRRLPHELIAAFRSTLQETIESDLLLHVIDSTDPRIEETIEAVDKVLEDIGAGDIPQIRVFNKIDQMETSTPGIERNGAGVPVKVSLSARSGDGVALLLQSLNEHFDGLLIRGRIHVPASEGGIRAGLYSVGHVLREEADGMGGWHLEVEVPRARTEYLRGLESHFSSGDVKDA